MVGVEVWAEAGTAITAPKASTMAAKRKRGTSLYRPIGHQNLSKVAEAMPPTAGLSAAGFSGVQGLHLTVRSDLDQ